METIKCPQCEKLKPKNQVYSRIDPFEEDVNNTIEYRIMCDECENESKEDI